MIAAEPRTDSKFNVPIFHKADIAPHNKRDPKKPSLTVNSETPH